MWPRDQYAGPGGGSAIADLVDTVLKVKSLRGKF